ncbi:rhomboid family intramembrane serine protease [Chitinophaga polysaccharea]|uniref:rhomboid family intramembrane serine protease n=1 Tax=Chitinophaga polysaccharea TaxID=1293035 RepID=UPI0014557A26|nr:rhomboid family intramembrane serine protease [Chitinophaga polysaccharea]NLR56634.1 rhomboid family intramembrane serine protease [Chitinophaga polysaccharea]
MKIINRLRAMPVTMVLIGINILVFGFTALTGMDIWQGNGGQLLHLGANYWPLTISSHQYWRLLSSMFLHAGLFHLCTNMIGLFIGGFFLEPVIRSSKYGCAYIVTGIVSDYMSIWYHQSAVGVGASGAIFGIFGVFLALLTTPLFRREVRKDFLAYIGIFIVLNVIAAVVSEGVDNAAHLAGFLSGAMMGYIFFFTLTGADGERLSR